ncbi:MAG: NTP transferase domain-containing protein [Deltaproteobacteria bacterium]|nr:NTP transferase domain-containing protein [Deltaproteobacteria bacterium]MBW2020087.1 NTP transferase domain-containing protein [Deltaproteobacteria bacterium]MBW2074846.1 NTP transferase domain-containing protein [Deltaproteobacteria bacterium]
MSKDVTKAVIPAAGLGTRLRPLTQGMPKELLPVGGKPIIQYTLEMYMAAGISEFCIITSPEKPQLQDFITGNWTPPAFPFEKDAQFFEQMKRCRIVFITQSHPWGVADAVGLAKDFVGNQPFACIMPDCLLFSDKPHAQQLLLAFKRYQKNVIGTIFIKGADTRRFGNVGLLQTQRLDDGCFLITSLSDKKRKPLTTRPGKIVHKGFGGGIYLPEYFDLIEVIRPRIKGEVDDVPIHQILIQEGKLTGVLLEGAAFDVGQPLGLRAAAHYAGRRVMGINTNQLTQRLYSLPGLTNKNDKNNEPI